MADIGKPLRTVEVEPLEEPMWVPEPEQVPVPEPAKTVYADWKSL